MTRILPTQLTLQSIRNAMSALWDQVDGWESAGRKGTRSGPGWEFIRRPLFEARTAELQEFGRVSRELEDILKLEGL